MKGERFRQIGLYLLVGILAYIPLFYHLDQEVVRLWDESRGAVNALEICENGNWIAPTFEGKVDHWLTKPPVLVWAVAASMKLFGYNTLAIRLPVALAGLCTAWMLLWFSIRILDDWRTGLFAALSLLTFRGFADTHVARTGDVDGLLLCWMTLFFLSWLTYVLGPETLRNRALWLSALGLCLAFMTKSSAAFLTLPGFGIWLMLGAKAWGCFKNWRFYAAYGLALLVPVAYYLGRESVDPGYLQAVWENEFMNRLGSSIENNAGPFSYYFDHIFRDHLFPYVYLLPFILVINLRIGTRAHKMITWAVLAAVIPFLLVISSAGTKLEWYDAQMYGWVALLLGVGISLVWLQMEAWLGNMKQVALAGAMIAFGLAVFGQNYYYIFRQHTSLDSDALEAEAHGLAMEEIHRNAPALEPYKVAAVGYNASAYFYSLKLQVQTGDSFPTYNPLAVESEPGTKILICNPYAMDSLARVWDADTLWNSKYGCQVWMLKDRRPADTTGCKLPPLQRRIFGRTELSVN